MAEVIYFIVASALLTLWLVFSIARWVIVSTGEVIVWATTDVAKKVFESPVVLLEAIQANRRKIIRFIALTATINLAVFAQFWGFMTVATVSWERWPEPERFLVLFAAIGLCAACVKLVKLTDEKSVSHG
jgi:hypothetical protein